MNPPPARILRVLIMAALGAGLAGSAALAATRSQEQSPVLIGASLPPGVASLDAFRRLKLGDMVLTAIPRTKAEALAMAEYCSKNSIHLCFSELLYRGGFDLCWAW